MPLIVPLDPTAAAVTYTSVAAARAAGAAGTESEVVAAIVAASARVDRVTRWWWAPRAARVTGEATPDGQLLLPRPVQTIDSVTIGGALQAPSSYRIGYSELGAPTRLELRGGGLDSLSYATVRPRTVRWWATGLRVEVVGTFGETTVPLEVDRATALLAAALAPSAASSTGVNVEGDSDLPPVVGSIGSSSASGVQAADELLRPLRRGQVRVS